MKDEIDNNQEIPEGLIQAILPSREEFVEQLAEDLCQIIRDELTRKGVACPTFDDDPKNNRHALISAYCGMLGRRVGCAKRKVYLNPSLTVPDEVKDGFEMLVRKFENGEDVNPHLNKFSAQLEKNDPLLYDWGIKHFHLGTGIDSSGFIQRTGPIAYAIVKEDAVYIITVAKHGHWSDKDLLEIVNTNWPQLTAGWKIDGEWEVNMSSEEIGEMRKLNINCGVKLDNGESLISPGGGINGAGGSALAVMEANRMYHRFIDLYKRLKGEIYLNPEEDYYKKNGAKVSIRLKRQDNDLILYLDQLDRESRWLEFHTL